MVCTSPSITNSLVLTSNKVINDFFTTYFEALQAATTQALTTITSIVNVLDAPKPAGIDWYGILTALGFGLAFLGAPTLALAILESDLQIGVKLASQAFLISLEQTPSLAKALYPTGTDESKTIQMGDLSTDLGQATTQLDGMINNAVQLLMSDVPTFIQYVQSGQYSGQTSYSLPNTSSGLEIALTTYLASTAMWKNSWYSSPSIGPYEPNEVASENNCHWGQNDVCTDEEGNAHYLSPDTGRMYSLELTNDWSSVTPYQLTQTIVNQTWAPLNILFDGAFNCTAMGYANTTNVQFTFNGTLNIACMSQLAMYTGCGQPCPCPLINGTCPFGSVSELLDGGC